METAVTATSKRKTAIATAKTNLSNRDRIARSPRNADSFTGVTESPEETLLASIMSIAIMADDSRAGFTIVNTISERSHVVLIEGWARSVALWRQLLLPCFELHATDEDPLTGLSASPVIAWLRSKVPRVAQG
jgi:hypothetical protein